MQRSEQINELAAALAKAQGAFTNPSKNRTVRVNTKSGGSYDFAYATFDAIVEAARKPLSDNGLAFTQTVESGDGRAVLVTTLLHSSGQWLASSTPLMTEGSGNQAFGSAMTYQKRYQLTAMLGISADEDDDGNAADGNTAVKKETMGQAMVGDSWKEWANGEAKTSDCALWCNRAYNELRELISTEDIDRWLAVAENKKRIRALHDHNEARYDKLMVMVEKRRDELRAKAA